MVMVANQSGTEVGLLAGRYPGRIGHLFTPGPPKRPLHGTAGPWPEIPFALDNGAWPAFKNRRPWNEGCWRAVLRWAAMSGQTPLWALVPDVVGDRAGTLKRWPVFASVVRDHGWRCAFAAQDGMTFGDVPDGDCMICIGGSDAWKEAAVGPWCARFPGRVHVLRVNGWDRLAASWRAGAVSVDGTGWFHRTNSKKGGQYAALRKFLRETPAMPRLDLAGVG